MKFRELTLFSGQTFSVPECIQRIDQKRTHGWQLRYGDVPTVFFADGSRDGSGAAEALRLAMEALRQRMQSLPAPTGLKTTTASRKTSDLPVGISGPYERKPHGRHKVTQFSFQVSVPLPQGGSTTRRVYIGTDRTMNAQKIEQALRTAVRIREAAVEQFVQAKNRDKHEQAMALATHPAAAEAGGDTAPVTLPGQAAGTPPGTACSTADSSADRPAPSPPASTRMPAPANP